MRQIASVRLVRGKETRNTIVYRAPDGAVLSVPTLYVMKFAFLDSDPTHPPVYPEEIILTVEASDVP